VTDIRREIRQTASMRVPGKVQASTSFGDDGHGEMAMRFARKLCRTFLSRTWREKVLRAFISIGGGLGDRFLGGGSDATEPPGLTQPRLGIDNTPGDGKLEAIALQLGLVEPEGEWCPLPACMCGAVISNFTTIHEFEVHT
jgi:hypothetical protein